MEPDAASDPHPSRVRRLALIALADLVAAAVVALLVFRLFGAWSGNDSNPATCFNFDGNVVSCSLTQAVLMPPTFVVVFATLAFVQVVRRRHSHLRRPASAGPSQS